MLSLLLLQSLLLLLSLPLMLSLLLLLEEGVEGEVSASPTAKDEGR